MKVFFAALIIVGMAVIFLCFNIIFRKGKSFPDGEIGHNRELRKRGIICAKEEERRLWGKKNNKGGMKHNADSCATCSRGTDCFALLNDETKQKV